MYKILQECGTVAIGSSELLQELLQLIAVEYQGSFWELMTIYETQGIEMIPDSSDVPNSSTSYWYRSERTGTSCYILPVIPVPVILSGSFLLAALRTRR